MLVLMVIGLQHLILKESKQNSFNLNLTVGKKYISGALWDSAFDNLIKFCFKEFTNIESLDNEIGVFLKNNDLKKFDYENIKVIHENDLFALVPNELYSEKNKEVYLKYNTKIQKNDFISTDDIDMLKIKNVYIPFIDVNNYMVEEFSNINYFHFNSLLLKKIFSIRENQEFFSYVNKNKLKIIIFKEDNLQFFNSYNIENDSDVIYYILLVLKENKFEINSTLINFIIDSNESELEIISKEFFDKIEVINKSDGIDFLM